MHQLERDLKANELTMADRIEKYQAIYRKADEEGRRPTAEEHAEIDKHYKDVLQLQRDQKEIKKGLQTVREVEELAKSLGPATPTLSRVQVGDEPQDRELKRLQQHKTLGELFTDSAQYKSAVNQWREAGGGRFNTGAVNLEAKGTLLEGAGGGGTGFVSVPQVVPGVVDKLFQRLTFADLLLQGQAASTTVRYVVEGTATSGAAGVAEAGAKPQSTLGVTTTDEPIKKIATSLKVSDEMIEDGPAIQSYINGRLTLFVRIEEERQLIRGASGGNEVQGLLTSRSVPVYAGGTAAGNKAVQLFKASNGMRGSALVEPDWYVVHPGDWQDIRLLTDTAGQFFGGGPFYGPYGGPQGPAGATGQVAGAQDFLWGKPVYVTGAVGAGTAIVGSTANAQVWRRGGLSVDATNSNEDDFLKNLVALRAEERLGLAVYRSGGYVEARLS